MALQKVLRAVSLKHNRSKTVTVDATESQLLDLLQQEPLEYIKITDVDVVETLQDFKAGDSIGEWMVVEKLSIPLVPKVKFKTRFTRIDKGAEWIAWAKIGILVESKYVVGPASKTTDGGEGQQQQQDSEPSTCQFIETATLTCPFFVSPLVRWQFNKTHDANLFKLQDFFRAKKTTTL